MIVDHCNTQHKKNKIRVSRRRRRTEICSDRNRLGQASTETHENSTRKPFLFVSYTDTRGPVKFLKESKLTHLPSSFLFMKLTRVLLRDFPFQLQQDVDSMRSSVRQHLAANPQDDRESSKSFRAAVPVFRLSLEAWLQIHAQRLDHIRCDLFRLLLLFLYLLLFEDVFPRPRSRPGSSISANFVDFLVSNDAALRSRHLFDARRRKCQRPHFRMPGILSKD